MDVKYGKMTEECVKIFHRADISASKIQKSETEAGYFRKVSSKY